MQAKYLRTVGAFAIAGAMSIPSARADEIKTVFVIAMENHNWTQPANQFTGGIQQIYQNPNAPFINSLVNGTAFAIINGSVVHTEGDGVAGDNGDDLNHTIGEIVISQHAHPNVNGIPYASPVNLTHSSDLRTMQDIFYVGPFIRDAANATDLSDLFAPGAIPSKAITTSPHPSAQRSVEPLSARFFPISLLHAASF